MRDISLQSGRYSVVVCGFLKRKGPIKVSFDAVAGKNQLAITLHMYASIEPNLDNTHRGQI